MPEILTLASIEELTAALEEKISALGVGSDEVFVVCDKNVAISFHVGSHTSHPALKFNGNYPVYLMDAEDDDKSIGKVIDICRWLISLKAGRSALLLSVGGGATSDIAGFAASIYKRGIRFANIPTTLLAQVDAAIGGKNGVNLDGIKNMLGCIRQPEFVMLCPQFLRTLPYRQFISGSAEMLKTFLIDSAPDYHEAVEVLSKIHSRTSRDSSSSWRPDDVEIRELTPLISRAAAIKSKIVAADPYEKDLRRILNLGHTYGHAIEWWQTSGKGTSGADGRLTLTHGEAVAIGIIKAASISAERGVCSNSLAAKLTDDFRRCGLPIELPCPESELIPALEQDKKHSPGKTHLVLLSDIGKAVIE